MGKLLIPVLSRNRIAELLLAVTMDRGNVDMIRFPCFAEQVGQFIQLRARCGRCFCRRFSGPYDRCTSVQRSPPLDLPLGKGISKHDRSSI